MRIKVQVDLNSPFKSWYSISDRFRKFSSLLDSLSADFGFDTKDISMTMDGFELPLFLDPFSILKEDDLILISRKRNGKRKIDDSYINTKKHKSEEILDTKKEQESRSDAGESDESSDSSESASSESSSDSDSSSSSETDSDSSSDESEETKAAEAVLKAVDPKLVKTLHKNKRKAVNNMLHVKPLHQKFDQNEPKVFNTKVELFNAPGTFSQNQMKRHRKLNKEAVPIEMEEDQENYEENQEYEETEGWEEAPNEETNVIEEDVNQNEQDDMELEDNNEPSTQALDAIDYNELPVLKEPKENAEIVYKTLELSLAYTAEISDYKRARILSFIPTKKSFKVVLQKLNPDIPKMPSSAWEPKIYDYIFPKARKFEIDQDEQDESTDNTVEVDWKDLIEVRLIK